MKRTPIYSLSQGRSFDMNWMQKDILTALGGLFFALAGNPPTVVVGLGGSQTVAPSLTINIAAGQIYQQAPLDASPFGSLGGDGTLVTKQGFYSGGQLTLNPTMSAGQSQWFLIEAAIGQADGIRPGDPGGGVQLFWNADNPADPLEGPTGNAEESFSQREEVCILTVKPGIPAATGTEVPPVCDAGNVPLYLIHLNYGQLTITTGQILVAGNSAYSGYTDAPFLAGLLQSHHNGKQGQAPKINLTNGAEVQGIAAFLNLPVTNQSPPVAGIGIVSQSPGIPILTFVSNNPNGLLAGDVGDFAFWTLQGLMYVCNTAGDAAHAVWQAIGSGGGAVVDVTFTGAPYAPSVGNNSYLCHTAAGQSNTVNLLASNAMQGTKHFYKNVGTQDLILQPVAGDGIEGGAAGAAIIVPPGDGYMLLPSSSGGYYIGA